MKEKYFSADDVIITDRLTERPSRTPDYAAESRALEALAMELAERPENLLQKLAETLVELGIAESAGVSIDETDEGRHLRWVALAGVWSHLRGGTLPFDASPCGVVVQRDEMLLFESPERFFPEAAIEPLIHETLLVPFHSGGRPVGTLWTNAHSPSRKFDQEDARLLKVLGRFASAGYQMQRALDQSRAGRDNLQHRVAAQTAELRASEANYQTLFETMGQGFVHCEIVRDANGKAIDFRYLDLNPAFERLVGVSVSEALGRTAREVFPGIGDWLIEIYDRVTQTGVPEHFESEIPPLDPWYEVHIYPRGGDHLSILYQDITERKVAEQALRRSEERFRALVTTGSDSVYRMSPDWRQMYQLDGQGFLADTATPSEAWVDHYILEEDRLAVHAAIDKAIRTKTDFELEHRVWLADGKVGWALSRAVPMLDGRGEIVEWFGTARDVTERRAAVEQLRESEERFRLIVESARDYAIFAADTEGRITIWPSGAQAVFGWTETEALGEPIAMTFTPEDQASGVPDKELTGAARAGFSPDVRWHQRKDGGRIFIEGSMRALLDACGAITGFLKIGQDVTERHATERALAESETRFRQFADTSPNVLWIRDARSLRMVFASPAFDKIYGIPGPDRGGSPSVLSSMRLIEPESRKAVLANFRRVRVGERVEHEFRIRRASDGALRWVHNTDFPLQDASGEVQWIAGLGADTTDAKEFADRQEVLVAELQHRTRNLVAVVRAIADKTLRGAASLDDFKDRFQHRLEALARVQGLLSRTTSVEKVSFDVLLSSELAALDGDNKSTKVTLTGHAGILLRSSTVQTFALALHELATNAVKYGALSSSNPDGRLSVCWNVVPSLDGSPRLHVDWQESGVEMPNVDAAPAGGGYGRELIERALPYQLHAETSYELGRDGVRCTIAVPIAASTMLGDNRD